MAIIAVPKNEAKSTVTEREPLARLCDMDYANNALSLSSKACFEAAPTI